MRLADEIQELFEEAMREVDRLSLTEVKAAAFGVGHWLSGLWPRMPCEGWRDELDSLLREYARNHLFITDKSRADIIAWVTAANEEAKRDALLPGGAPPRTVRIAYGPRPRPAALHSPYDKPAPLDPAYPALRRVGHIIMEQFPPVDWLNLATSSLKRHSVPEEIAKQFLQRLEDEQRKANGMPALDPAEVPGGGPTELAMADASDRSAESVPQAAGDTPATSGNISGLPRGALPLGGDLSNIFEWRGFTEAKARGVLVAEVGRWRGNGWNFAANLLQYFLDRKAPAPYAPIAEVSEQSLGMVEQAIYRAIWSNTDVRSGNLNGARFKFTGDVRWIASGFGESMPGSIYGGPLYPAGAELIDANDDLFYAFAGATMTVEGTITHVGTISTPVKSYLKFDVVATVTITDDYTFKPEGGAKSRLAIEAYDAANFLERRLKGVEYKPFPVAVKFDRGYTGLRSDRIAGGTFHSQRPFRPGEPVPPPYKGP